MGRARPFLICGNSSPIPAVASALGLRARRAPEKALWSTSLLSSIARWRRKWGLLRSTLQVHLPGELFWETAFGCNHAARIRALSFGAWQPGDTSADSRA